MGKRPVIDIIIPSFNGRKLLQKHLPKVIKNTFRLNKIIVVDDGGEDDTRKFLSSYKNTIILKNNTNLGFTKSINRAVKISKADFVVLLNNDVHPKKGYLEKAIKWFSDEKIFAVTFSEDENSYPEIKWSKGKLQFTQGKDNSSAHYSAWASGGSAIFRRDYWKRLGGFREIYSPGYWEDIDLGWRAWKAGYKIIWDPQSEVVHQHESTFKLLDKKFIQTIKQRNELLFIWQNFSDLDLLLSHKLFLIRYAFTHPGYFRIIFIAVIQFILKGERTKSHQSDKETISKIKQAL